MEVNLTFFIVLLLFLLLMLFFDWYESRKRIGKSEYKQLAYRSVITTLLILFFLGFKTSSFVIDEGSTISYSYDGSGKVLQTIKDYNYVEFPYTSELTYISLAFLIFYLSILVDTIPRPAETGIRFRG